MEDATVGQLRRDVANAVCTAQDLATGPRTPLLRMLYSLLLSALAGLDSESGLGIARGLRLARHALAEWERHVAVPLHGLARPPFKLV